MAFALPDHWVWDFWLADDGARYHLFCLHAPKSLGNPDLRHRNARIGHATSTDLTNWTWHGVAFEPGRRGSFDETATWTGSIVRGDEGLWRMFYTGASFLSPDTNANIESVGLATSPDLFTWTKVAGPLLRADSRWYETLGMSSWPEEAWRDPWVYQGPDGQWHMLVTARANHGDDEGRGVIAHAVSADLDHWEIGPPQSEPQSGFSHLEVPHVVEIEGRHVLVFCCDAPRLANARKGQVGGVWTAPAASATGPFDISKSQLLADQRLYAGRLVQARDGRWMLLAFMMNAPGEVFRGGVSDPIPLRWTGETFEVDGTQRGVA